MRSDARNPGWYRVADGRARGFTLTELLIVIAILGVVLLVGLPAFASMLRGSERTLAENQLRQGLQSALTAAVGRSYDTAAVFFYTPPGPNESLGRTTIVPYQYATTISDADPSDRNNLSKSVVREVFVPFGGTDPVQLPLGWMVRGSAPSTLLHNAASNPDGWYVPTNGRVVDPAGGWVFPETSFYDVKSDSDLVGNGAARQTFMIRFEAGTGIVRSNKPGPVLLLSPRASSVGVQTRAAGASNLWRRCDLADRGLVKWVQMIAARPDFDGVPGMSPQLRRILLGDESGDTVLACSVGQLALYEEQRLAKGLGFGVNKYTASLYARPGDGTNGTYREPTFDMTLAPSGPAYLPLGVSQAIDQWLEGRFPVSGGFAESDAALFTIDRSTGRPREIIP